MRVLLVASTDSYNAVLPEVGKVLTQRNHQVLVITTEHAAAHNHAFEGSGLELVDWQDFDAYSHFDVAIFGNITNPSVQKKVEQAQIIRVGLFFHLTIDDYVLGGANLLADYTLCFGKRFIANQARLGVSHNFLPIGVPYDSQEQCGNSKILLFLEQHFYPSGKKGKQQLADFLVSLAKHSGYKVVVKPRSLVDEESTHHKADHLYHYINEALENLVLLNEHRDLHELTAQSSMVMTTFSTAAVPAIVMDKPVLFVEGFAFEETYYYNRNLIKRYYDLYRPGKNIMHFSEVLGSLAQIEPMPPEIKNDLIHPRKAPFGQALSSFLEFAYSNPVLDMRDFNIDNFFQASVPYKAAAFSRVNNIALEKLYRINMVTGFRMSPEWMEMKQLIETGESTGLELKQYESQIAAKCEKLIQDGLQRIFSSFKRFPVGFKGLYLKFLYDNGMRADCESLPASWHIADYFYNKFLFARSEDRRLAAKYLKRYLRLAKTARYRYTPLYEDKFIAKVELLLQEQYGETA